MLKKIATWLAIASLAVPAPAFAQLGSVPNVFTSNTRISSSEVNSNFATAYANALNRTGGTMTGTLTTVGILPTADNVSDIGSAALSYNDGWFDGTLTVATLSVTTMSISTLTCTGCVGATQLAATTVVAGSYGTTTGIPSFTVDADGRITAAVTVAPQLTFTSTYFSSLSLANGTGLPISTGVSGLGTGIATALAVNTGSAGAPVLFDGAGGTPTSLTLTNGTGLPAAGVTGTAATLSAANSFSNIAPITTLAESWIGPSSTTGIYFKGGYVGIGTTAPKGILDISVGNPASIGVRANGLAITSAFGALNSLYQIGLGYGGVSTYQPIAIFGITTSTTGYTVADLAFATRASTTDTAPTERMRILSDGKVGIGRPNPSYLLDVNGTFNAAGAATLASTLEVTGVATFTAIPVFSAGITEASINDGTLLARLAANETVTGAWTFNSTTVNAGFSFRNTNVTGSASVPFWLNSMSGGSQTSVSIENGGAGDLVLRTGATTIDGFGTARITITAAGATSVSGTLSVGGGSAISSSSNVALLDAANVFTTKQTVNHAGGTLGYTEYQSTGVRAGIIGSSNALTGTTNDLALYAPAAGGGSGGGMQFWTGGNQYMTLSSAGLLTVSGFGTHSFSASGAAGNILKIENSNGAAGYSQLLMYSRGANDLAITAEAGLATIEGGGATGLILTASNASTGDLVLKSRGATALTLGASQAATFAGNVDAPTFSAGGDSGYTGATCTAFTGGICTTGSEPAAFLAAIGEGDLRPRLQALEAEVQQLRTMLRAQGQ